MWITLILEAHSGKGRLERLWGIYQDRLVSELCSLTAKTTDAAQALSSDFLPNFAGFPNRRSDSTVCGCPGFLNISPENMVEIAVEKGAAHVLMPISARKQLNDLPDDVLTEVTLFYYSNPRDALIKGLAE